MHYELDEINFDDDSNSIHSTCNVGLPLVPSATRSTEKKAPNFQKFLLRENKTIGRIRIDKIILNDRFPIHHPDFIPLIEHIKEYRTISRKLIDSEARFNKLHHDAHIITFLTLKCI